MSPTAIICIYLYIEAVLTQQHGAYEQPLYVDTVETY